MRRALAPCSLALLLLIAAVPPEQAAADVPLGPLFQSVTVAAGDTQDSGQPGACGYGVLNSTSWPYGAPLSIRSDSPLVAGLPFAGCGACFRVACSPGQGNCSSGALPVVSLVVDSCPSCSAAPSLLQLPVGRFNSLSIVPGASVTAGVQQVACQPPGNITLRILNNPPLSLSIELVVLSVAGGNDLVGVALKNSQQDDSAWLPLSVFSGAVWQARLPPPPPLDFRLTNGAGQVVVARGVYDGGSGGDFPTGVQFPAAAAGAPGQAPSAAAAGPAAPAAAPAAARQPPPLASTPLSALTGPQPAPAPAAQPSASLAAATPLASPPGGVLPPCPGDTQDIQVASANASAGQPCRTLLDLLEASPSLSSFLGLLRDRGVADALNATDQQLTLFAPLNEAFDCNVFSASGATALSASVEQLVAATPNSLAAIVGGQVVPGYHPAASLQPAEQLNTTDMARGSDGGNQPVQITVAPASVGGPIKVQGVGSVASILAPDLQACGPSVIHVTDTFLLPFAPTPTVPGVHSSEGPPADSAPAGGSAALSSAAAAAVAAATAGITSSLP